jgi:3-methyladenine DNA glycosylase AlkD
MELTADSFIRELKSIPVETGQPIPKIKIFTLAKKYIALPVPEVEKILKRDDHDCRVGAVAILDWKARAKTLSSIEKEEIYLAYINNHDWIDDWGLVDRAAPYVIGGYLFDKDRSILYELAKSNKPMERRTAIVSTYYFIKNKQIEDTFNIAEILIYDEDMYVQKAVGSWIREAGKQDIHRLKSFLDEYAPLMPRITLQYAIEKLDRTTRDYYLGMKGRNKSSNWAA